MAHHITYPVRAVGRTFAVVNVRRAGAEDLDGMVEVMFAEPGVEQIAFMPTISGGRRFSRTLWSDAGVDEFLVADDEGSVVGFAWVSEHEISLRAGARAAVAGWGPLGPFRLLFTGWPRQLVEIAAPEGPTLIELQVHPSKRGEGIGSILLRHVIDSVGQRSLSLTTRSDNPARRLYERHGFSVMSEKSHRSYERRTGAKGRILMTRPAR